MCHMGAPTHGVSMPPETISVCGVLCDIGRDEIVRIFSFLLFTI